MVCEKTASMTIGISMDQEICLIFWTGFTQFILLEEKPPNGCLWSGGGLTKRQATSRPDYLWPELWTKLPQLDNAKRLRGIYCNDHEDKELKETIRNAEKKLETPMAPAISPPNYHEDQIAGRGHNSLQHCSFAHKFYSYASSNQDTHSQGSSG